MQTTHGTVELHEEIEHDPHPQHHAWYVYQILSGSTQYMKNKRVETIDPFQRSSNASNKYRMMHISVTKWCIVWYGCSAVSDLCNRTIAITTETMIPLTTSLSGGYNDNFVFKIFSPKYVTSVTCNYTLTGNDKGTSSASRIGLYNIQLWSRHNTKQQRTQRFHPKRSFIKWS